MEKLICFIYIVLINFVVCLAQSNKTIIPVKELSDENKIILGTIISVVILAIHLQEANENSCFI